VLPEKQSRNSSPAVTAMQQFQRLLEYALVSTSRVPRTAVEVIVAPPKKLLVGG